MQISLKWKWLPETVSFDEFKGHTGGERFQWIVIDPLNRCIFDVQPTQNVKMVQNYLLSLSNHNVVRYVTMDMNRGFREVAKTFLPNELREAFYSFMEAPNRVKADHRLDFRFDAFDRLNLPEFKACRKMLVNWRPYILNAFDIHLSNGFTEGCNNAIKALKRLAFGFRNFDSFRARILLSMRVYPNI